jgi:hypothetical protein
MRFKYLYEQGKEGRGRGREKESVLRQRSVGRGGRGKQE